MKYPIFRNIPLLNQSIIQKLLGQQPFENAIIELNNFLVNNSVRDITSDKVVYLSKKYGIDFLEVFSLNLEEFYAVIYSFSLIQKGLLYEDEIADDLNYFKKIFHLNENRLFKIQLEIGKKHFEKNFEEAIVDGRLTNENINSLKELGLKLNLSQNEISEISQRVSISFFEKLYQGAISKDRIKTNELMYLYNVAKGLNINLSHQYKTSLERLNLYWIYENEELKEIETSTKLHKSERCFFILKKVKWYEEREALKKRYGYSVFNSNKQILPQNLKIIDIGDVLLTNKRLIFIGLEKTTSTSYDKIIRLSEYKDSIVVDKGIGRSPIFNLDKDIDVFYIILKRLKNEFVKLL